MSPPQTRRPNTTVRRALMVLALIALTGLLVWGFRPTPRLVDAEPVTRGHLAVTLEAEGRTRVIDRYQISAPIAAQARRIQLEVGDAVTAGEVVAVLDALAAPALDKRSLQEARERVAAAEADLGAARAAVKSTEATANQAEREQARIESLARQGMVSHTQLDQARADAQSRAADLASTRFRAATAEHALQAARTQLAFAGELSANGQGVLELRSPVAGRVLKRAFESARVVQPGDPILEIGDPTRLEIEADVLSADAVRLAPGMRVWLERWGEPDPLEARIDRIEPVAFTKISALGVEEQRVWVISDLLSPPVRWARLGDAYRVNARFVLWEADDVLQVPTSSLFRGDGGWAVFRISEGRAHLVRVEIGRRGALRTELRGGLAEGDRVIVHPDREVTDGARIQVRGVD